MQKSAFFLSKKGKLTRVTRRLPFELILHRGVGEGATPFPELLHFTLDPYLIMLSVKQVCWLVGFVLWHINLCRLFNAKSIFIKIVLFQTISTQFKCKYSFIVKNISI